MALLSSICAGGHVMVLYCLVLRYIFLSTCLSFESYPTRVATSRFIPYLLFLFHKFSSSLVFTVTTPMNFCTHLSESRWVVLIGFCQSRIFSAYRCRRRQACKTLYPLKPFHFPCSPSSMNCHRFKICGADLRSMPNVHSVIFRAEFLFN